jgi:hypothetical protein
MGEEKRIQNFGKKPRRDHLEDLRIDGGILKLMIKKLDEITWTGFIWLRTGTSGGLL